MSKSMRLPAGCLSSAKSSESGAIRILVAERSRWMIRLLRQKRLQIVQMTERRARIRSTVVKGLPGIIRSFVSSIEAPQYEIRIQRCWRERLSSVLGKVRDCLGMEVWTLTLILLE